MPKNMYTVHQHDKFFPGNREYDSSAIAYKVQGTAAAVGSWVTCRDRLSYTEGKMSLQNSPLGNTLTRCHAKVWTIWQLPRETWSPLSYFVVQIHPWE